jgi:hypothetical protein
LLLLFVLDLDLPGFDYENEDDEDDYIAVVAALHFAPFSKMNRLFPSARSAPKQPYRQRFHSLP